VRRDVLLAEEIGRRVAARDGVEGDEPGAALDARPRLVEADVPRLPDAEELEVDPAGRADGGLVALGRRRDLLARPGPVGDVGVGGRDVDVVEEVLLHEAPVAVEARRRHRVVLVEVEGHDAREAEALLAVEPDELAVDADRGGAGGEPQDGASPGGAAFADDRGDAAADGARERLVRVVDDDGDALEALEGRRPGCGHGRRQ
jgi:hypothetical protein